jgi:hypothetical protein
MMEAAKHTSPAKAQMASYSVFFDGPKAFGIQPVDAVDAAHAVEIATAIHPESRLAAVPTKDLDGCNPNRVLAAWLTGCATMSVNP